MSHQISEEVFIELDFFQKQSIEFMRQLGYFKNKFPQLNTIFSELFAKMQDINRIIFQLIRQDQDYFSLYQAKIKDQLNYCVKTLVQMHCVSRKLVFPQTTEIVEQIKDDYAVMQTQLDEMKKSLENLTLYYNPHQSKAAAVRTVERQSMLNGYYGLPSNTAMDSSIKEELNQSLSHMQPGQIEKRQNRVMAIIEKSQASPDIHCSNFITSPDQQSLKLFSLDLKEEQILQKGYGYQSKAQKSELDSMLDELDDEVNQIAQQNVINKNQPKNGDENAGKVFQKTLDDSISALGNNVDVAYDLDLNDRSFEPGTQNISKIKSRCLSQVFVDQLQQSQLETFNNSKYSGGYKDQAMIQNVKQITNLKSQLAEMRIELTNHMIRNEEFQNTIRQEIKEIKQDLINLTQQQNIMQQTNIVKKRMPTNLQQQHNGDENQQKEHTNNECKDQQPVEHIALQDTKTVEHIVQIVNDELLDELLDDSLVYSPEQPQTEPDAKQVQHEVPQVSKQYPALQLKQIGISISKAEE